jgi:hypothetical protein
MATAKELWDVLHKVAEKMPIFSEQYVLIQEALDSGADDSIIEECIEELESAANFMRGVQLDPRVPSHAKTALRERTERIDALTERLTMGAAATTEPNEATQ